MPRHRAVEPMARGDKDIARSGTLDEAVEWHVRLTEADEKTWTEFTAWLEADPAHRIAFDRVEDIDRELENEAFSDISDAEAPVFASPVRRFAPWIAAAGLAASFVLAFLFFNRAPAPIEYATRTGETRTVNLADGTQIHINTATVLRVDGPRHITLEKGEALFHVASDPGHPFVVTSGDRNIRDIGTVFDVLRSAGTVTVVVAEGRVGVSPRGNQSRELALQQGDRLVHSEATGATTVEKVDPDQALAWRHGYLVYRNAPLSVVVGDLNRYFAAPIALDPQAAKQRFTGVLRIDNQDAVLNRISQFLPIRVDRGRDGRIVLRASAARP